MRRLLFVDGGSLRWDEVPAPSEPSRPGALVRPIASTTCDLDRAIIAGRTPFAGPFAIGHEAVAEVLAVGEAVTGLAAGDTVVVPWHLCCTECARCRRGSTSACERVNPRAMYGLPLGGEHGGLFDEVVEVPFAAALVPLPPGVDPSAVASASDNLTDAYRAVEPTLRARPGGSVLILGGTGSISVYATAWARVLGAGRLNHHDPTGATNDLAVAQGASTLTELPEQDEDGYDLVVDACANAATMAAAIRLLAPGGDCHSVGIYFDDDVPMPLASAYMTGVSFSTGRPNVFPSIREVLAHVAAGRIDPAPVFSERLAIEEADTALVTGLRKPVFTRERRGST